MHYQAFRFITYSIFVLFALFGCASHSVEESTLTSKVIGENIELSVPASKLVLSIPKIGLIKQPNKTDSYRYFYYYDKPLAFGVSGWFEPESQFIGAKKSWEEFIDKWHGAEPKDVSFSTINGWEVVTYILPLQQCKQLNAKAHMVKSGTWIELHASSTKCSKDKEFIDIRSYIKQLKTSIKTFK